MYFTTTEDFVASHLELVYFLFIWEFLIFLAVYVWFLFPYRL